MFLKIWINEFLESKLDKRCIIVYNYTRMQKRDTGMYRWSVHCPLWEKDERRQNGRASGTFARRKSFPENP